MADTLRRAADGVSPAEPSLRPGHPRVRLHDRSGGDGQPSDDPIEHQPREDEIAMIAHDAPPHPRDTSGETRLDPRHTTDSAGVGAVPASPRRVFRITRTRVLRVVERARFEVQAHDAAGAIEAAENTDSATLDFRTTERDIMDVEDDVDDEHRVWKNYTVLLGVPEFASQADEPVTHVALVRAATPEAAVAVAVEDGVHAFDAASKGQ